MREYVTLFRLKGKDGLYQIKGFVYENEFDRLIPEGDETAYEVKNMLVIDKDSDEYKFLTDGVTPTKIIAKVKIKPITEE